MMKWKDRTSYSHSDKERAPEVLDAEVEHITITVYKHIDYPDTWLLLCPRLIDWSRDLGTHSLDEAKKRAIKMVIDRIDDEVAALLSAKNRLLKEDE